LAKAKTIEVEAPAVERFRRDLDALVAPDESVALAVSGGPDSLALLLLAAEARPLKVEAATVDHALRPESRAEAEMVAALCERLGVPHRILTATWDEKPESAIQERARLVRYQLLGEWARERGLTALLTAHHLDDQAETFLMRLSRGAGARGLGAMRGVARPAGGKIAIVRPLLGWRRAELEAVCAAAGVDPVQDPSNDDEQFERVRVRKALAAADWLNPASIAVSARNLAQADEALRWAATQEWKRGVTAGNSAIVYRPSDAPREIKRRIIRRAVLSLSSEGGGAELRGRELDQLLVALNSGQRATLRGVLCVGGEEWRFTPAPARRT
jgi:tRNA(Ile)-lysidine synthase